MKKYKIFVVFVFSLQSIFSQENLIQNIYLRKGISLNGQWNYIVDMYETGYYDYRRVAYDSYEKPGANAFFLNSKPRDKMDLIEYDFDKSPVIQVPGDWNSQEEKLFFMKVQFGIKKLLICLNIIMKNVIFCTSEQ